MLRSILQISVLLFCECEWRDTRATLQGGVMSEAVQNTCFRSCVSKTENNFRLHFEMFLSGRQKGRECEALDVLFYQSLRLSLSGKGKNLAVCD